MYRYLHIDMHSSSKRTYTLSFNFDNRLSAGGGQRRCESVPDSLLLGHHYMAEFCRVVLARPSFALTQRRQSKLEASHDLGGFGLVAEMLHLPFVVVVGRYYASCPSD